MFLIDATKKNYEFHMLLIANTLSVSTKYGGVIQRLFNTFDIFKVVGSQNRDIGPTNDSFKTNILLHSMFGPIETISIFMSFLNNRSQISRLYLKIHKIRYWEWTRNTVLVWAYTSALLAERERKTNKNILSTLKVHRILVEVNALHRIGNSNNAFLNSILVEPILGQEA